MDRLNNLSFVGGEFFRSWLECSGTFAKEKEFSLDDEKVFTSNLPSFFSLYPQFRQDVNITKDRPLIFFFKQTVNIVDVENKLYSEPRETAKMCSVAELFVYHSIFINYNELNVIVNGAVQSIWAHSSSDVSHLPPNPICSLWVTFSLVQSSPG